MRFNGHGTSDYRSAYYEVGELVPDDFPLDPSGLLGHCLRPDGLWYDCRTDVLSTNVSGNVHTYTCFVDGRSYEDSIPGGLKLSIWEDGAFYPDAAKVPARWIIPLDLYRGTTRDGNRFVVLEDLNAVGDSRRAVLSGLTDRVELLEGRVSELEEQEE